MQETSLRFATFPFLIAIGLGLAAGALWVILRYVRGGVSTGVSKRAVAFALLVYAKAIFDGLEQPVFSRISTPLFLGARIPSLHLVATGVVALAACWVWFKAKTMQGYARMSATVIAVLAVMSLAAGFALYRNASQPLVALNEGIAMVLLAATVWHAYEMRVYPVS